MPASLSVVDTVFSLSFIIGPLFFIALMPNIHNIEWILLTANNMTSHTHLFEIDDRLACITVMKNVKVDGSFGI